MRFPASRVLAVILAVAGGGPAGQVLAAEAATGAGTEGTEAAPAADAAPRDPGAAAEPLDPVVVTGTRRTGQREDESSSPIQVIDRQALQGTGLPDLMRALAEVLPAAQAEAFGSDTAALTSAVRLRGLNPNDTLVLINGKRRHGTANLSADNGSPFMGSAAADLSLIPAGAIARVEVLTDAAAAQYGSDAIGGVVNLILRSEDHGGDLAGQLGGYLDEGGRSGDVAGNFGFRPWDGAFAHLTLETRYSGYSNRGAIDPRMSPACYLSADCIGATPNPVDNAMLSLPGYPRLNRVYGDPALRTTLAMLNAGADLGAGRAAYLVVSAAHKSGLAFENYRLPDKLPQVYPLGFDPSEGITEDDAAITAGLRGDWAGWQLDLGTTWGHDRNQVGTFNTVNVDLFEATGIVQQNFRDGEFRAAQWTTTLDATRDFDLDRVTPLTVAWGLEQRGDRYQIIAGEPHSRFLSGPVSYPGFTLTDAGNHARTSQAAYLDLALGPVRSARLDLAARTEHFGDFGSAHIGRLAARYDATPRVGLRGALSTGFRAPSLAEEYYSSTNVGPSSAFVQLPPDSPAARLLGIPALKPERSDSISLGLLLHPAPDTRISLDAYQITLRDRIVGSGNVNGNFFGTVESAAVNAAIAANGNVLDPAVVASPNGQTGISVFSNAASTRTRGAELNALLAPVNAGGGRVTWSLAAAWIATKVTAVTAPPAQIAPQKLLDLTAVSQLEGAAPRWRAMLGADWQAPGWSVQVKEQYFGECYDYEAGDDGQYYRDTLRPKFITSVMVTRELRPGLRVTAGANNLFNVYPDKRNPALQATYVAAGDNTAVLQYVNFAPFGVNGGFYYLRTSYAF